MTSPSPSKRRVDMDTKPYENKGLTRDEIYEIKEAFDLFDTDGGGSIDPQELKDSINSLGMETKNQSIYQMINELDADGSGSIEFGEFFDLMTASKDMKNSKEDAEKVFKLLEENGGGYISLNSLTKVVRDLGENLEAEELSDMIERADTNNDGKVTFDDFYNIMDRRTTL